MHSMGYFTPMGQKLLLPSSCGANPTTTPAKRILKPRDATSTLPAANAARSLQGRRGEGLQSGVQGTGSLPRQHAFQDGVLQVPWEERGSIQTPHPLRNGTEIQTGGTRKIYIYIYIYIYSSQVVSCGVSTRAVGHGWQRWHLGQLGQQGQPGQSTEPTMGHKGRVLGTQR